MECKCGKFFLLGSQSVHLSLNTNEEGEEYTEYLVECPNCGANYEEGSEWGHRDVVEIIDVIMDDRISKKCI